MALHNMVQPHGFWKYIYLPTTYCSAKSCWVGLMVPACLLPNRSVYSLIVTAKLNDVDPRAWLADVLRRIADHRASRLHELLPWNWARERERRNLAA